MNNLGKTIANNALAALTSKASVNVVSAIKDASTKTGVDFAYMVQQAAAESSFTPAAKARTSSASGLYQFIEGTWMNMIEKYGEKHGIVTEGHTREELLRLRNDPQIASKMAAELAAENKQSLEKNWGGDVGSTELYFAHFMGAGGAASFMKARDENPAQVAAHLFPSAAKANYNVFYDRETGQAKSLEEVYQFFDKKFSIKNEGYTNGSTIDSVIATNQDKEYEYYPTPIDFEHMAILKDNYSKIHNYALDNFDQSQSPKTYNRLPIQTSYADLLSNPLELMLLTQLDVPVKDLFL